MASTKGAYLKHIRYDSTTPYRIERYLERENWSKEDWRNWIDSSGVQAQRYTRMKRTPLLQLSEKPTQD